MGPHGGGPSRGGGLADLVMRRSAVMKIFAETCLEKSIFTAIFKI